MAGYILFPINTDPDAMASEALAYLMRNVPGYIPHEGNLEVWLIEVASRLNARTRDLASRVPPEIFKFYGQKLVKIAPIGAAYSNMLTTWTMVDAQGYTIPARTRVAVRAAGDILIVFETIADTVIPTGSLTAANVAVTALDAGAASNGYGPGAMVLIDSLAPVNTVVSTTASSGGVDAEDDATYLGRLSDELTTMSPRPILPVDFAILARRVAGVTRALILDGYNPNDLTTNNERMITVFGVDEAGNALSAPVKAALQTYLDSLREVNFVVWTADPTYTAVNVVFHATSLPGYQVSVVEAAAEANVLSYLDPATWGGGDQNPPQWVTIPKVRLYEIAAIVDRTPGIDHVDLVTINGVAADLVLGGVAPLPGPAAANVADGTVVPP